MKTETTTGIIEKEFVKSIARYKKESSAAFALMDCLVDEYEFSDVKLDEVKQKAAEQMESLNVAFGLVCDILADKGYIKRHSCHGIGELVSSKEDMDKDYMAILKTAYASLYSAKRILVKLSTTDNLVYSDYINYNGVFAGAGLLLHNFIDLAYELPDAK